MKQSGGVKDVGCSPVMVLEVRIIVWGGFYRDFASSAGAAGVGGKWTCMNQSRVFNE